MQRPGARVEGLEEISTAHVRNSVGEFRSLSLSRVPRACTRVRLDESICGARKRSTNTTRGRFQNPSDNRPRSFHQLDKLDPFVTFQNVSHQLRTRFCNSWPLSKIQNAHAPSIRHLLAIAQLPESFFSHRN